MIEDRWVSRLQEIAELHDFAVEKTACSDPRTHDRLYKIARGQNSYAGTAIECFTWLAGWEARAKLGSEVVTEVIERGKPFRPDAWRIEIGDWDRAAGDTKCSRCGCCYFDHAPVIGAGWLRRLCDGRFVKL